MTKRDDFGELERRLQHERPAPPDDLVRRITATFREPRRAAFARPRLALAAALTFALFTSATALGGVNAAASSARGAVSAVTRTVTGNDKPPAATSAQAALPAAASASAQATPPAPAGGPASKVDICHATGSSSNPYVLITVDVNGLNGHDDHGDDVVPAPPTGCPGPSPGNDQYKPGKGCGDKNHVHFREGQCTGQRQP